MTPSPPDEALHFRGKTLTPESPRPLHIPEPANIPVLENQMDPVFNDTSTYERAAEFQTRRAKDGWIGEGQARGLGHTQDSGSLHGAQPGNLVMNDMAVSADFYHSYPSTVQSGDMNVSPNTHTHTHAPPAVPVHEGFATTSEIDNADHPGNASRLPEHLDRGKEHVGSSGSGVNFQTLLDNLSHLPPSELASGTTPLAEGSSIHQAPKDDPHHTQGISMRPLQDPSTQTNYIPNDDGTYHQRPSALATPLAHPTQPSNNAQSYPHSMASGGAPGTVPGAGSLPPPPTASFQTPSSGEAQTSQEAPQASKKGRIDKLTGRLVKLMDDDAPWGPEVQKKYDEFLHDERVYVTEGLWDRFPMGSRLFVGNLPTERVTKRDMFHIFHKYGKLAQISIKQAYGFIQFLEAGSCHAALEVEQGALIRGRKIRECLTSKSQSPNEIPAPRPQSHLERPLDVRDHQNSAGLVPPEPTHVRPVIDTSGLMNPEFPSAIFETNPRIAAAMGIGLRGRLRLGLGLEMGIDLEIEHQSDSIAVSAGVLVPLDLGLLGLLALPIPEIGDIAARARDLEATMKEKPISPYLEGLPVINFVLHVENAFRNRGLRVDVLVLGPRIPLGAAVHRQYVEGVLAVVRLSRPNQFSRKIPLQIFDRSPGLNNVRFIDYPEVDPNIAAEVMFHQAQAMQRGPPPGSFPPNPAFGVPPVAVPAVPVPQPTLPTLPALTNPPNIANLISSLDGPSLQSLLSALQRPAPPPQPVSATQSPFASPNPPPPADLATLLTNAARQPPILQHPQQPLPPPFHFQPPNGPVVSDPHLLSILAKGLGGQQPQGQPAVGSNVQNLMNQLAKWKQ
ncbi:hypothetical protein N7486_007108 [Penicillium sp. IBT 16267x]|nr:hypothetical protein N7486_007108 [Penicillium sp. IBT 16267x]